MRITKPKTGWLCFATLAMLVGMLGLSDFLGLRHLKPAQASTPSALPADCRAGTLVTVVAHLDDDLLFVNPGISDRLHAGWCIVTVHLIGGANDSKLTYVLRHERGVRQAYARMAGVPDQWSESTVSIAGQPMHRMALKAAPRVVLLEMRLPGGQVRGGRVPLGLLWDEGETIASYPMNADGSGGVARYDRAALAATLGVILSRATLIYTLNPDTVPFVEHPDHIYAARITREAARDVGAQAPLSYHLTYVTSALPMNVPAEKTQQKRDEVASYFAIDGGDTAQVFGEYEWNGDWVARRYAIDARVGGGSHEVGMPAINLVNARTSQCLSAGASGGSPGPGAHAAPRLAACDGGLAQQWRWQPLPSYPGNPHDAALVNASTSRCVAERHAALVEETCDPGDIAQRFTPWDFGIVRTPFDHCLGEKDGAPALAPCDSLTTAYRWASTPHSQWTDLRMAGAMYGDVTGDGEPSAVYVERRRDGPGFDVEVVRLEPGARPARWYRNVVPFDSKASVPSCRGDALCFDSTRFLLADFTGTGRADLMAIAPAEDGTAFWRFPNTGAAFAAPQLWYKSAAALSPARTQQYVSGDFDGGGRADVMIAQRTRDDRGFDLWVLTSRGATGNAPSLWRAVVPLAPATRFFAAHVYGSPHVGVIAVEDIDGALAVSSIASSGRAFAARYDTERFNALRTAWAKVAVGPIDGVDESGLDGLVVLSRREPSAADRANIDVWTIAPGRRFGEPVHAGTIGDVSWTDALPALVARGGVTGSREPTLALFERVNATLDEYHFTGGSPALAGYALSAQAHRLGRLERWSELPGRYSETLRLDRLQ
jgi:GlcNAc-PI de-N-acetylase